MKGTLAEIVKGLGHPSILVIGDMILDRYTWGSVTRISPEAPIPVFKAVRSEARLGGAGVVAANLAALGADVTLIGVVGADDEGRMFRDALADKGISDAYLVECADRSTTVKTRMIAEKPQQHVLRVDSECDGQLSEKWEKTILQRVEAAKAQDIVVLSDYNKGLLSEALTGEVINICRKRGLGVIVDPAPEVDYAKYAGAEMLTPNRAESQGATGLRITDRDSLERAAQRLVELCDLERVVITLDKDGMALLERGGRLKEFPTRPRAVFDVTGAGDTVISVLAAARAGGATIEQAIELANVAAGIEIERVGASAVSRAEILNELREESRSYTQKIKSLEELREALAERRRRGETVVLTNGCFDLLHYGHIRLLEFCSRQGDIVVVGMNSDASVRAIKEAGRPVIRQEERASVLAALADVDYIVLFDEEKPLRLFEEIRPDILVKGMEYQGDAVVGRGIVEAYGGRVVSAPMVEGVSTTSVIERIVRSPGQKGAGG